jgi:mono/diheme cytochrome c family protein
MAVGAGAQCAAPSDPFMKESFPMRPTLRAAVLLLSAALAACGGGKADAGSAATTTSSSGASPAAGGLSDFEQKHGIGPVTEEVKVGPVDAALAKQGHEVFESKCSACHKADERYVGPPLGGVTERRSPTYVMNMMLNPEGMYTRHPEARKLLGEYMTQMPNQQLTRDDARAVMEYLRTLPAPK